MTIHLGKVRQLTNSNSESLTKENGLIITVMGGKWGDRCNVSE